MTLPYVVTYSIASLDGRMTLSPDTLLLYGDPRWQTVTGESYDPYPWLMDTFHPQVFLEGSGSFVAPDQPGEPFTPLDRNMPELDDDFLPPEVLNVPGRNWFAAVDGRGRIHWSFKEYPDPAWAGWYALALVCAATPREYRAFLRRESIPYLLAGDEHVDLRAVFEKLHAKLGVERLMCTAGGRLCGALLRAKLVNEVVVEFGPALIGGEHTSSLFHAPDLRPEEAPTRLERLGCEALDNGRVRLHYRVLTD